MQFAPQFLDEIRARVPLAQVVSRRVRLVKRGREFTGLCPFHNEKSPSFTVSEEKGFFHCFGCGAHGDVIGFIMRDEGLPFPEAVERLAREGGMEPPKSTPEEHQRQKQQLSLYQVLEDASSWFEQGLRGEAAKDARAYLDRRGLTAETIETFGLGFAPQSREGLKAAFAAKSISETLSVTAGLLIEPDGGGAPYDRFRGRIIFPIGDRRGRIVGFGGRALGDGQPKYLNSPDTPVFNKGSLLYGAHLARKAAHDTGRMIVVEGYMDVIALHQAGIPEAVAPLGTALTELQMEELWRIVDEPVLCFDGDAAGPRAAQRAAERALPRLRPGKGLRFITLPDKEDPDSLVRAGGAAAFHEVLAAVEPLSAMLWRHAGGEAPLETPEARAKVSRNIDALVEQIGDTDMRAFYRRHYRELLFARKAPPSRDFAPMPRWDNNGERPVPRGPERVPAQAALARDVAAASTRERSLLQAVMNFPALAEEFHEELERFPFVVPRYRALRDALLAAALGSDDAARADLNYRLTQAGLETVGDELVGKNARYLDILAADEADIALAEARIQVRHLLDLHHKLFDLESFKREAAEAFAADMSEENWQRMLGALGSAEEAPGTESHVPGYQEQEKRSK